MEIVYKFISIHYKSKTIYSALLLLLLILKVYQKLSQNDLIIYTQYYNIIYYIEILFQLFMYNSIDSLNLV